MAGNAVDHGRSVTAKIAAILTAFNAGGSHHMTDVARLTGLPVTTAHRLIHELVDREFLSRSADGTFRPGPSVHRLSSDPARLPTLQERAPHVVEDLVEALRRRVRLGVLDGLEVSYIEKAPGYTPVTSFSPAARLPAHATAMGKALLAFARPDTIRLLVTGCLPTYTCRTLARADQLLHALQTTRRDGVATSRGELTTDSHAVAVPVLGPDAPALAAIEVEVDTVAPDTIAALIPALRLAAHALIRELHPRMHALPAMARCHPSRPDQPEAAAY
jgi:DNA-binding IclR family transcriptional regulator